MLQRCAVGSPRGTRGLYPGGFLKGGLCVGGHGGARWGQVAWKPQGCFHVESKRATLAVPWRPFWVPRSAGVVGGQCSVTRFYVNMFYCNFYFEGVCRNRLYETQQQLVTKFK